MTEVEKAELTALIDGRSERLPRHFLYALLAVAGTGAFFFLYAITEVLPWHT